jgi:hypothetical protein
MEGNVVSLETAKKLKAAGFPQVTHLATGPASSINSWTSSMPGPLQSPKR